MEKNIDPTRWLVALLIFFIFILALFPGVRQRTIGNIMRREAAYVPPATAVPTPTIAQTMTTAATEAPAMPQVTGVPTEEKTETPETATPKVETPLPLIPTPTPPEREQTPEAVACVVDPNSVVWSADFETGNLLQWQSSSNDLTTVADSGACSRPENGISRAYAHSGQFSMEMTITTTLGKAGCRQFRKQEPLRGEPFYYSAWFYIPEPVQVDNFWNIFQFKSQSAAHSSDVFWKLEIRNDDDGTMRIVPVWKGPVPGPHAGDPVERHLYRQTLTRIPVGVWFHLEVYLQQSENYDGHIIVWQDGVEILNEQNVVTKYQDGTQGWSVNNYGADLTPATNTLYIDDVVISTKPTSLCRN